MRQDDSQTEADLFDPRRVISIIARKWWVVASVFVVVLGGSVIVSLIQRDTFETNTKLLITAPVSERLTAQLEPGLESNMVGVPAGADLSIRTLTALMISGDILEVVVEELGLRNDSTGAPWTVDQLSKMLKVDVIRGEREDSGSVLPLATLTARGDDPRQLKLIADKWVEVFIRENTELFISEAARSFEFVQSRYQIIQQELRITEEERVEYQRNNPLELLRARLKVLTLKLSEFLSQRESKRAELVSVRAELSSATKELAKELPFINVQQRMSGDAILEFLANSPNPLSITSLPDLVINNQERNELYDLLKGNVASLTIAGETISAEVSYLEERTVDLQLETEKLATETGRIAIKDSRLDSEIEVLMTNAAILGQRLQDALIAKAEQGGVIRIVQSAREPASPVGPHRRRNILVAGALGLLLGVFVAFSLQSWADSSYGKEVH